MVRNTARITRISYRQAFDCSYDNMFIIGTSISTSNNIWKANALIDKRDYKKRTVKQINLCHTCDSNWAIASMMASSLSNPNSSMFSLTTASKVSWEITRTIFVSNSRCFANCDSLFSWNYIQRLTTIVEYTAGEEPILEPPSVAWVLSSDFFQHAVAAPFYRHPRT